MTAFVQPHELTWGTLVLSSEEETDLPYRFEALVGMAFGNPAPMVEVVRSYLDNGELAVRTGWGNREDVPVFVRISALDADGLAQGEAALAAEFMASEHSPLVWTPPTLGAWPMVFEVVTVTPERDWQVDAGTSWDYREKYTTSRVYKFNFTTRPFTHAPEATIIPALPVPEEPDEPADYSVVDACGSTTGWAPLFMGSTWSGTSFAAASGALSIAGTIGTGSNNSVSESMIRTGAVSMAGTPYLTVDISASRNLGGVPAPPSDFWVAYDTVSPISGPSVVAHQVVATADLGGGRTRFYFDAPATFGQVRIARSVVQRTNAATSYSFSVSEVGRTDRLGIDGTNGFQVARTVLVEGTAPTAAAIRIDSGTDPLIGSTAMVYTGQSPVIPLRALCSNTGSLGDLDVDATKMSGATNDLSVAMVFRVPIAQLSDATYTVLARLDFLGAKTFAWQARLVAADGSTIPGSDLVLSGTVLLRNDTADPLRIHALAAPRLPVIVTEGETTDAVELTLSMPTDGASVRIDEGWLVNTTNGAVTIVHEPSAFQLTAIELRSAQLGAPRPSVYGTWSGGRVQDITRLARLGTHRFEPGLLHIFTATDLAKYAPTELEYYRRYFLHPGPALPDTEG